MFVQESRKKKSGSSQRGKLIFEHDFRESCSFYDFSIIIVFSSGQFFALKRTRGQNCRWFGRKKN